MTDSLIPTTRLRWVRRPQVTDPRWKYPVLQQFWAEPMPDYMRDIQKGEWRDIEVVTV